MALRLPRPGRWFGVALRIVGCAVAAAMFARVLSGVDWGATLQVVRGAGPAGVLALVPFGMGLLLDTTGVLLLARAASIELRATTLLGVRVVSEALHFGAPGGVVASEAAALALLVRRCGIDAHEATVIVAGRKWLVMRAHAIYLVLGACVSAGALATIGKVLGVHASLAKLVLLSAGVPLVLSVVVSTVLARGRIYRDRIRHAWHVTTLATLVFVAQWLVECAETAVILRLMGVPLPVGSVLAIESALSLARSAVAFMPGGLGVQDIGYATALTALGATHETAAAFVILKRGKEIVWIAAGFALGARTTAPVPAPQT